MNTVINEIEFDFTGKEQQIISIRTDAKLSKADVRQIVLEADEATMEEIVYQSLLADELYLRARAKEVVAKLKGEKAQAWEVKTIEYWDDEGNKA